MGASTERPGQSAEESPAISRLSGLFRQDIDVRAFYRGMGVFAVVLVALALSWGATQGSTVIDPARADAGQYVLYAWNLKYHGVYSRDENAFRQGVTPEPDAVRTPGYPLFLTAFVEERLDRSFIGPVQTVQSLLVGGTVLLAFLLFRYFMPYAPSLAGAGIAAISPHLANSAVYLLTESLFAFTVVLALYLAARLLRRPGVVIAALAGVALGYGALVRPTLTYLPLFMLPVLWFHLGRRERVATMAVFLLGFMVVYGAWGARNLVSIGQWSDTTLVAGTVQHGMYPDMMYEDEPESYGVAYNYDPATERIAGDTSAILSTLVERAAADPGRYAWWYLVGKPLTFWQWGIIAGMGDVFIYPTPNSPYHALLPFRVTHAVSAWLHWPAVFMGALGCLLAVFAFRTGDAPGRGAARLVAATLLYFTVVHMVGAPYPRYSIPVRPELYGMAVFAAWLLAVGVKDGLRGATAARREPPSAR